jgi:hypothetical protein
VATWRPWTVVRAVMEYLDRKIRDERQKAGAGRRIDAR